METSGNTIYCPLHPKEAVKRIDLEFGADKELYCIECLLNLQNPTQISSQLKSIDDFVDMAASYYATNRKRSSENIETPEEFLEILEKQTDNLSVLSKHIEEEKKRVDLKFDEITKDVFKMINQKRDEYFHMLDKQLFNYRYGFIFFEKQLRKAFPKEDDAGLYPTKEELFTKLSKLQNATQMMAFVKNIKEDLNENKLLSDEDSKNVSHDEARRNLIKTISKKLEAYKFKGPTLIDPEADMTKLKEEFEKATTKLLDGVFTLNNEIEDIASGDAFP
jgi:DNA-binding ferritin-like protein